MGRRTAIALIGTLFLALGAGPLAGCATPGSREYEWTSTLVDDPYPLDPDQRRDGHGEPDCPHVQVVNYAGDVVPYHRPLKVNPFFRERLQQFEMVVQEVAVRFYGRPPSAIRHMGAYNCRRIRGKPRLSEHAFANAIDVSGFDFGPADGRPGFRIVLKQDWEGSGRHSAFLRALVEALADRPDIFRGMLGPGSAGHEDHFHFDVGPYRYLDIRG